MGFAIIVGLTVIGALVAAGAYLASRIIELHDSVARAQCAAELAHVRIESLLTELESRHDRI